MITIEKVKHSCYNKLEYFLMRPYIHREVIHMFDIPAWAIFDSYTILLLLMLCFFSYKKDSVKTNATNIFNDMLLLVLFLVVLDMLSHFAVSYAVNSERGLFIAKITNYLVFVLDPVMFLLAFLYLDRWMVGTEKERRVWRTAMISYIVLHFVLITVSEIFGLGWFYYYQGMVYHRGPLFMVRAVCNILVIVVTELFVLRFKDLIDPVYRATLLIFMPFALVFGLIQALFYGLAIEYGGMMLAMLILYINIQNRDSNHDYLTGVGNRRILDAVLQEKIRRCQAGKASFSMVMIDMDRFKEINDSYGHQSGDEALEAVARLLLSAFREDDCICRFGGDEFLVVADIDDENNLKKAVDRFRSRLEDFNAQNNFPFKIELSIGYAVYEPERNLSGDEFISVVDKRMYEEKEKHHMQHRASSIEAT